MSFSEKSSAILCTWRGQQRSTDLFQTPSSVAGEARQSLAPRSGFSVDSEGVTDEGREETHLNPVSAAAALWEGFGAGSRFNR